ncbi:MAG: cation diffusion facilitator family transporter [Arenimonas sp.]
MAGTGNSTRAIFYALGANLGIFVAKLAAAMFTGSGAMLAEAVHSLADCGNQGLLLLGMKRAKLPPTPDFPLGYGKETYFWSFLVALMLFSVGGAFSVYEGLHKLSSPEPLEKPWLAIGVLVFSIVLEWLSLRACLQEINKVREKNSLWHWFQESRNSEMIVLFGEQLAALLGLVFALAAIGLSMVTGNPVYDAIGTIGIGVLLIVIAVFVAIEIKALLIGQSAAPARRKEIEDYLHSHPHTMAIHNVITLQLGPEIMVSVKVGMNPELRAADLIAQINTIEAEMRQKFPEIKWLFFEPDLHA